MSQPRFRTYEEIEASNPNRKPDPPAKRTRPLTREEQFAQLDWQPVDWGDERIPPKLPHAVAWSRAEANYRMLRVFKLNTGAVVWDVDVRDRSKFSTPKAFIG